LILKNGLIPKKQIPQLDGDEDDDEEEEVTLLRAPVN
jgi:hypothetical protein